MARLVCRYETGPLERRQQRMFDPLLAWVWQELGWDLHTSSSIYGTTQSDTAVAAVQQYLEGERSIPKWLSWEWLSYSCTVTVQCGLLGPRELKPTTHQAAGYAWVVTDMLCERMTMCPEVAVLFGTQAVLRCSVPCNAFIVDTVTRSRSGSGQLACCSNDATSGLVTTPLLISHFRDRSTGDVLLIVLQAWMHGA